MKQKLFLGWVICLTVSAAQAQQANEIEALKRQLQQATENFDKTLQEHRKIIDDLNRRLQQVQAEQAKATSSVATAATTAPPLPGAPWRPTDPIRLLGGQRNYLNLSFDGLFSAGWSSANDIEDLQPGGHDPKQRGFTVQNIETTFEGMVDPYFRGQAAIVYQIDPEGESFLELEEAYVETMSLPANFQIKAGQYFSEFGRLNPTHPHSWDFADQPLVNGRFLGEDGLRNAGARLSWLTPTPFYSELFLSVQNSQGETAFSFRNGNGGELFYGRPAEPGSVRAFNDLLFVPRYALSFNLSDSQTLVAGVSGAFGPNGTGRDTDTQIYGADLFWKWKPVNHTKGFPFVAWQTEAMLRKFEAGAFNADLNGNSVLDPGEPDILGDGSIYAVPRERLTDWGVYSQVLYGFRPGWIAGLRGDFVTGDKAGYESLYGTDPLRDRRWRISPNLTWYPTEFSKVRLQYNYDDRRGIGRDHSVWLQFEFLLGAHAAHKF